MRQFDGRGRFKTGHRDSGGIDIGEQAFHRAVFAARVHGLQHDEKRLFALGVKPFLEFANATLQRGEALEGFFFRPVIAFGGGVDVFEAHFLALGHDEVGFFEVVHAGA